MKVLTRRVLWAIALIAAFALGSIACASSLNTRDSISSTELLVVNRSWADVVVYVDSDGQRVRVGMVTAATTRRFWLAARMLGAARAVRLLGDPIGSQEWVTSELIHVASGQRLEWWLEPNLYMSSVMVF